MVYVKINGNRRFKWSKVIAEGAIKEFKLSPGEIKESDDYDLVFGDIEKELAEGIRDYFHSPEYPGYCARIDDYL